MKTFLLSTLLVALAPGAGSASYSPLGPSLGIAAPVLTAPVVAVRGSAPASGELSDEFASLERGLGEVNAARILADVAFLADDELEGRNSPGRGLRIAARYIAARLERLGWTPSGNRSWFYDYPIIHRAVDPERSGARLLASSTRAELGTKNATFLFGEDYFFSPWDAANDSVRGELTWCGSGSRDELDGLDLEGRVALCSNDGERTGRMRANLRRAGALGAVVIRATDEWSDELVERSQRSATDGLRGSVSYPKWDSAGQIQTPKSSKNLFRYVDLTNVGRAKLLFALEDFSLEDPPTIGSGLGFDWEDERRFPGDAGLIELENVCGLWPGSDATLAREVILISAHYDHVGVKSGSVYNGADDNASGTSALLAMAEALRQMGPLRRSVMLLWVSAEEKGLFGSKAFADKPSLPDGMRIVANINLDMVGRNGAGELYFTPTADHPAHNRLAQIAESMRELEGFSAFGSADQYYERSDHYNFARQGIPVIFFFNGEHDDYHKPTDTTSKIDADKIRRVTRMVLRMLMELQSDELGL